MNSMKHLMSLATLLSAGAIAFAPGEAAGGTTSVGSLCQVYDYMLAQPPPNLKYTNMVFHGSYDESAPLLGVTCPLPVENTLGTTVNFRARVFDNSTTTRAQCYGAAYDQNGTALVTSAAMNTSVSGTGVSTLTSSITVSPQSSSYTYGIHCTLPGNQSAIYSTRVY